MDAIGSQQVRQDLQIQGAQNARWTMAVRSESEVDTIREGEIEFTRFERLQGHFGSLKPNDPPDKPVGLTLDVSRDCCELVAKT